VNMVDVAALVEQLCGAGLLDAARPLSAAELREPWAQGLVAAVEGHTRVGEQMVRVRVGLPLRFPGRLPLVFAPDLDLNLRLPHIRTHGWICFQQQEGQLLDRNRPVEVVRDALARALEVLRAGRAGENRADFIEELALHWPGAVDGIVFFPAEDEVREVHRVVLSLGAAHGFFAERPQARTLTPLAAPLEQTWTRGLYIPLSTVPRPIDPFPRGPWTPTQVARFVRENLAEEQARRLDRIVRGLTKPSTFVILRVPRPRGGDHLVGVDYHNVRGSHPLARRPGAAELRQFQVVRRDPGYLVARGGGAAALRTKRVLLAGCGAIGGHLAFELIRCGVGRLTLVDPDVLRAENQHRHVLGAPLPMLNQPKSMLLAADIQMRYPGVQVDGVPAEIEDALDNGVVDAASYDLVVSATGDPNVDRSLNERLLTAERRPALMFTWLEPLGIGGHALISPRSRKPGCFECLFTPHPNDAAPVLANRAALAAAGQVFTREMAGCGNAFTPYSSIDANRTAGMAARLAVSVLLGELDNPLLRSWKGSCEAFRAAGLHTSDRYDLKAECLERGCSDIAMVGCPVCGG